MSAFNKNPLRVKQNFYLGNIWIMRKTASLNMLKCQSKLVGSSNQLVMTKLLLPMLKKTKLNMHFVQKKMTTKWMFYSFCLEKNLKKNGEKDMAKRLINLRKSKEAYTLSTEQCLSVRAYSHLSKGQYKKINGIFNQNLDLNPLQPPSQLDVEENKHLLGATDFQSIDRNGTTVFNHQGKENIKPINILSDLQQRASEIQSPNVKGVRYNYAEVLVSTLLEIDPYIDKSIKENPDVECDQIFHTTVKDGGDGLGIVSVYKEKAD